MLNESTKTIIMRTTKRAIVNISKIVFKYGTSHFLKKELMKLGSMVIKLVVKWL